MQPMSELLLPHKWISLRKPGEGMESHMNWDSQGTRIATEIKQQPCKLIPRRNENAEPGDGKGSYEQ